MSAPARCAVADRLDTIVFRVECEHGLGFYQYRCQDGCGRAPTFDDIAAKRPAPNLTDPTKRWMHTTDPDGRLVTFGWGGACPHSPVPDNAFPHEDARFGFRHPESVLRWFPGCTIDPDRAPEHGWGLSLYRLPNAAVQRSPEGEQLVFYRQRAELVDRWWMADPNGATQRPDYPLPF